MLLVAKRTQKTTNITFDIRSLKQAKVIKFSGFLSFLHHPLMARLGHQTAWGQDQREMNNPSLVDSIGQG
jgi:hypothetical protein